MANIKVSEMTEATSFDDGDYTMIVQANQNKKISKENILGDIENDITNNTTSISEINTNIGDLANLETSDTSSLVDSINSLTPKVLFENTSETDISINLPTINEYEYIDVSYLCNNFYNTRRIYKANYNNENNLISIYTAGGVFIIYCNNWKITGTSFARSSGYYLYMTSNGVREINTNSNNIKITKIIGYK